MIKIKARVKLVDDYDYIESVGSDVYQPNNNVSASFNEVFEKSYETSKVFLLAKRENDVVLGGSALDSGFTYSDGQENYYISRAMSSNEQESEENGGGYPLDGNIDIILHIYNDVSSPTESNITIVFDEQNIGYATKLQITDVDGVRTVTNHSTTFKTSIKVQYPYDANIRIQSWSKPNSPIIVSSIYDRLVFEIDESRMLNCEFELNEKADPTLPKFGVISNDGSIEFKDYDGLFLSYIERGMLKDKKKVSFYLENTVDRTEQEISTFLSNDVSYDDDSRVANISLVDNLVAWQDVKDVRIYLQKNKTMKDVYDALVDLSAPLGYEFADIDNDNEFSDLKSYLMSITLGYFFLKNDNLWAQWQKFCEATGLYLYINKENKIVLGSEFNF